MFIPNMTAWNRLTLYLAHVKLSHHEVKREDWCLTTRHRSLTILISNQINPTIITNILNRSLIIRFLYPNIARKHSFTGPALRESDLIRGSVRVGCRSYQGGLLLWLGALRLSLLLLPGVYGPSLPDTETRVTQSLLVLLTDLLIRRAQLQVATGVIASESYYEHV